MKSIPSIYLTLITFISATGRACSFVQTKSDCQSPPSHSSTCHAPSIVLTPSVSSKTHNARKGMSKFEARIANQISSFFDNEEVANITPFESTFPFVSRLVGNPSQARNMIGFLRQETSDLRQIVIFAFIGYLIPLIGHMVSKKVLKVDKETYKTTGYYHLSNHISQGFILGALTTLIETISEMILGLGKEITVVMTNTISSILFSIWGMYRVKYIKNLAVRYFFWKWKIENKRVQRLYQKGTDVLIYLTTAVITLDTLGFKYQSALKSISVFGGLGTIIFSLASKDMLVQLLSGLSIHATQQFDIGDEVQLEGGELGTVEGIGPLHTYLRGHDEIVTKISNSELDQMRVSNLSLSPSSQVKQELRFDFSTLNMASELVEEIKSEIQKATDQLILDGSRPFRVHWTGFGEEWLEITVDARLNIPPFTDEYYDARQQIMIGIASAVDRCNARFAEDL